MFLGYGVVARRPFDKGDFLLEYVGECISEKEGMARDNKYGRKKAKYPRCYLYYFVHDGRRMW